ncbi:hypothetical protein PILCRDRAFT_91812 [Piloderma croceum F 1598]|uniref:Uncharacterized protein n=1 Tax=Piloderma croceum (strain F 1598) TaxID=765440 RepID=A0A0C3AQ86_PILCF|nr:hypothetical protein PILCRDRAFT_91812 [Piloderma croceum F 1598]
MLESHHQLQISKVNKGLNRETFEVGTLNKDNWEALVVVALVKHGAVHGNKHYIAGSVTMLDHSRLTISNVPSAMKKTNREAGETGTNPGRGTRDRQQRQEDKMASRDRGGQ